MKIYLTQRNSDTTEGRGPMVNDRAFTTRQLAAEYIDSKPGIMGRMGKWSEDKYGDWKILEIEVIDHIPNESQEKAKKVLNSLSLEEKRELRKLLDKS